MLMTIPSTFPHNKMIGRAHRVFSKLREREEMTGGTSLVARPLVKSKILSLRFAKYLGEWDERWEALRINEALDANRVLGSILAAFCQPS